MSEFSSVPQVQFEEIAECIRQQSLIAPNHIALIAGARSIDYLELNAQMDQIAAAFQREGLKLGDRIAICAGMSIEYATVFLGALRAGIIVAPLASGLLPHTLKRMLSDAKPKFLFTDASSASQFADLAHQVPAIVSLDGASGGQQFQSWVTRESRTPEPVSINAQSAFNIIYSSGTTGEPKGIVQSHGMRWAHVLRAMSWGLGKNSVAIASTPLYSNTTLVVFFPILSFGGTVILMPKFNALEFLRLAQMHRVTHAMLVPVQFQRLMACEMFDTFDLSSFQLKLCTSAPFNADLKAEVIARWPGGLIENYGMTEGGGSCMLEAHNQPKKLHTVGKPFKGSDIRLINEAGVEVSPGEIGEVVGHSAAMMTGYYGQPERTREVEWYDPNGKRFIRTGDIGRFDEDGFLTLLDRKKDMIISGGFNVFPSDLENVLRENASVLEAAVVGAPSNEWGETPVAFVVRKPGAHLTAQDLLLWANSRVAKTQRIAQVQFLSELPRNAIGKVLKGDLRNFLQ